ncbi:MAG TPA: site-2 protease family protein [Frankiaceae bacterium]|nr:site-2 protease family protein [Frankiaceae bacterium]
MALLGVLVFVFALLASIALHEIGHLVTAKKFGMKASRYFIGMGPTVWSTWRGETEYGVKALPIGGFVKIVGMTQLEDLDDPRDEPRAFWRQPAGQRAIVLSAGSAMHFVIAFVVMYAALVGFGEPTRDTMRVASVSQCLQPDRATGSCEGQPQAPARAAGLHEGDRIVAFDGQPVDDWEKEFTERVRAHPGGPAEVVVDRDGEPVVLRVNVALVPDVDEQGNPKPDKLVGRVGLLPGETKRYNAASAIGRTGSLTWELTTGSLGALAKLPGEIPKLFTETVVKDEERGISDGGAVGIVDLGRFSAQAFTAGDFLSVLSMIAALNVFVGIFNLLPLLPLDGGHLAVLGFEEARTRVYRVIGRRDPGRVDLRKLMPAMVAFIVVMGSVAIMLVYAGIANPIANPFQ